MTLLEIENQLTILNPDYFATSGGVGLGKLAPCIEEAVLAFSKRNWISVGPRSQHVACLRGASMETLGNGARNYKIAPTIGTVGERALQSVGLALSSKRPVLCIVGNTALADGRFLEALNLAVSINAPVLFLVLERNTSTMPVAQLNISFNQTGLTVTEANSPSEVGVQVSSFDANPTPTLVRVSID